MVLLSDFFRARLDLSRQLEFNPDGEWQIQGGFESFISEFIVLRLGYDYNHLTQENNFTIGLGFEGPRLKLDYAYVDNGNRLGGALHSIDLRIPF
jgi:hypothetical protein